MGSAAAYLRLSVREKAEGSSLDGQRAALEGWAQTLDDPVELTFYVDDGYSGTTPNRPQYLRMLAAVAEGKHSHIVARSVDRLGRDLKSFIELVDIGDSHKTAVVAISEALNSHTESGRLMLNLLAVFAEAESRTIGMRGRYSHEQRRSEGRWTGGAPPFGLTTIQREGGSFAVIDPDTVDDLRIVVQKCIDGESFLAISRWLNEQGHRSSRGYPWSTDTVSALLRNPVIAGLRVTHADPSAPYEGRRLTRGRRPTGPGRMFTDSAGVPIVFEDHAAIDLDTWRKLQQATERRRAAAFGRNDSVDREPQLLNSVARCGTCGGLMSRSSSSVRRQGRNEQYETYRCGRGTSGRCERPVTIKADMLNSYVVAYLEDRADDELYEIVTQDDSATVERRRLMQDEIDRLAGELASADETKIADLSQRIAALRREITATPLESHTNYQPSGVTIGDLLAESPRRAVLSILESVTVRPSSRPRVHDPLETRVKITPSHDPVADEYMTLQEANEDAARDWFAENGEE